MSYNNQNLFQDTVVFGNFVNCDDIKTGGNQANAKFKRDVVIGGNLNLGRELSTTTNGVTTYTDTGGNITFKINGVTYTITPTILSYLSTISSNIQNQINNITTPDLSSYAPIDSPTFTSNTSIEGDLNLGLSIMTTNIFGAIAYENTGGNIIVKINGVTYTITPTILSYLSTISSNIQNQINNITTPDLSLYAPKASPTFTGTPLAPTPTSIYDNSTKLATTEWIQNLLDKFTTSTKVSQYIVAYTNDYLIYPLNPTYNILGKSYSNFFYNDAELFTGYFVSSSGTGISSGYGWNDGIWKALTEGRYYVEVKLSVNSLSGNDNQFVLYVKDVNNSTITSKTIYSATSGQTTINYKTGIVIPANGYFTIIKEGGNDINLNWGTSLYTNSDVYASIKVTQIY